MSDDVESKVNIKVPKKLKPCGEGRVTVDGAAIACDRQVQSTFAPGHDSRLVGILVRAELAGKRITVDGMPTDTAASAAAAFSEKLSQKAAGQVEIAHTRAARKPKPEAEPVVEPGPGTPVTVKVGRREYEGTLNQDGTFTHQVRGKDKVVQAGAFEVVDRPQS